MRTRNEIEKMRDTLYYLKDALEQSGRKLGVNEAVWHGFLNERLEEDAEFPKSYAKQLKITLEKLEELAKAFGYDFDETDDEATQAQVAFFKCVEWILEEEEE